MLLERTRHRFSVADYDQMIESGILSEDHRVELIRGEILEKMSIGQLHAACVMRLNRLFMRLFGDRTSVSIQGPVRLQDSEPEPDVALLVHRADCYESAKPEAKDALLIVEVADSSLEVDRLIKGPLYAENGIAEYWIVNLTDRTLEIYRDPENGVFANGDVLRAGDSIELVNFPGAAIDVNEILGTP